MQFATLSKRTRVIDLAADSRHQLVLYRTCCTNTDSSTRPKNGSTSVYLRWLSTRACDLEDMLLVGGAAFHLWKRTVSDPRGSYVASIPTMAGFRCTRHSSCTKGRRHSRHRGYLILATTKHTRRHSNSTWNILCTMLNAVVCIHVPCVSSESLATQSLVHQAHSTICTIYYVHVLQLPWSSAVQSGDGSTALFVVDNLRIIIFVLLSLELGYVSHSKKYGSAEGHSI